jgi:hypothetical protein
LISYLDPDEMSQTIHGHSPDTFLPPAFTITVLKDIIPHSFSTAVADDSYSVGAVFAIDGFRVIFVI